MMLGGVPISVTRPPRIVANDSGIRVSAGLRLAFLAASRSTGMSRASAATLFITAESAAATPAIMAMWRETLRDASLTWRAIRSIAPELYRPRLTIRTIAMIAVAG